MRKPIIGSGWRSVALTVLALAIVACSHHHNDNGVAVTTNNTTTNFASSFGTGFGADFGQNNMTQPANVATSDVNPASNTTEPTSLANATSVANAGG